MVTVSGNDPSPAGVTVSGLASFRSTSPSMGAPFQVWTTVPSGSPSAVFVGQSNHIYAFRSVAIDRAGNVEPKAATLTEASTYLPDLDPPDTQGQCRGHDHVHEGSI